MKERRTQIGKRLRNESDTAILRQQREERDEPQSRRIINALYEGRVGSNLIPANAWQNSLADLFHDLMDRQNVNMLQDGTCRVARYRTLYGTPLRITINGAWVYVHNWHGNGSVVKGSIEGVCDEAHAVGALMRAAMNTPTPVQT